MAASYDDVDMQSIAFKTQDLMRDLGAKDSADVASKVGTLDQQAMHVERTRVVRDLMDTRYQHQMAYQRNTDLLVQMNESANANVSMLHTLSSELGRVSKLDAQARKDLYRSRQAHLQAEYLISYYRFATNVTVFSIVMVLALMLPVALWRAGVLPLPALLVLDGVLLAAFVALLLLAFMQTARRRSTAWDKYYWKVGKIKTDDGSGNCGADESAFDPMMAMGGSSSPSPSAPPPAPAPALPSASASASAPAPASARG